MAKIFFLINTFLYFFVVRSQSYAYDYGYATNPTRYTRKIHIKQGVLQGVVVEPRVNRALPHVEQYLGVPYAAPPTRELRFMPPGSAPSWFGIKIADSFGPVCPQKLPEIATMAPERAENFEKLVRQLINQSEDCLYLNIYAPVQDHEFPPPSYPVMVFLHGESFEWNSGNPYDGSVLAAYGKVIVVTLNFRLGVFGFLKTGLEESAASNFGLVDQVAALLWVQENIAAFGGDPNSVTLFGHGTGAACANLLMLSPMIVTEGNKPLFRRVILMGGTALSDWALTTKPRQITYQVAHALNCPSNEPEMPECLRQRSSNDILNATVNTEYFWTRFGPIIDSRVVPNDPKRLMARYNDVFKNFEMMYGVTEIESAHLLGPVGLTHGLLEKERNQELTKYLRTRCDLKTDLCASRTLEEYVDKKANFPLKDEIPKSFGGGVDKAKLVRDQLLDMLSDARSLSPMVQLGRLHSIVNPQSYFYVFGHTTTSKQHLRNKSIHGDELPYVFGVPMDGPKFHFNDHYTPRERLFSEVVMTYFTNFAHTGNPNMPRKTQYYTLNPLDWLKFEIEWPEYDIHDEAYLYLSIPLEVRYHYRSNEVRFWNEVVPSLLTNKPSYGIPETAPPWFDPPPISKSKAKFGIYDNFSKAPNNTTEVVYGTPKFTAPATRLPNRVEYETVITTEPDTDTKNSNATNLLVIVGCLFLLVNIVVFAGLYYKCIRLKNKEKKRQEEYQAAVMEAIEEKVQKVPEDASAADGCNLMRMISKSSKSEDIYEAVRVSEDGSNTRFKLMRQMSSSTIDPHTKVRDWIAHEIVHRCSPRFLRRTKQQLAEEHRLAQQKQQAGKAPVAGFESTTIGSNSTFEQSPTRPVSPEQKPEEAKGEDTKIECKPTSIPIARSQQKKSEKVSVAIDATPAARGSSVLRQQPIELTKSFDYQHLEPTREPPLRRSFTMDDVVNLNNDLEKLKSSADIILKPSLTTNGLKISHSHSRSDPVHDIHMYVPQSSTLPKKLRTFDSQDVNVTSKDEAIDLVQPLTPEQQLQTIKRRNFPKVLPDLPSKETIANKRRSMPVPGYLNMPVPDISSFSQPTSPTGKNIRIPPAPPPRTTSNKTVSRVCHTPAALAEEPPTPNEPEVTFNNLYIGPLLPSTTTKKPDTITNQYKQNIQQIYEHLNTPKSTEPINEKRSPKAIITTDIDHPVKRIEPKVVIKPTLVKKPEIAAIKGARVVARNSSDDKYDASKSLGVKPKADESISASTSSLSQKISDVAKPPKPSQIPMLKSSSPVKKESSGSESTPSEESDTGTVVKRV